MFIRATATLFFSMLFSVLVSAHSAEKANKPAQTPKCEAFLKSLQKDENTNDPVTLAMMKKCKVEIPGKAERRGEPSAKHGGHDH